MHRLHHQPKPVFVRGVQSEAHYGCLNFAYRAGLSTPAVVYRNKWPSDWTQWWFYHKVESEEYLVSKCEGVKGNRAPDVRLKASQETALEAFARCAKHLSTRDLVEEFLAAGIWPLSRGWSIPAFGEKGPEGLCRPHPAVEGFAGTLLDVHYVLI
jgi:hypothetical protein